MRRKGRGREDSESPGEMGDDVDECYVLRSWMQKAWSFVTSGVLLLFFKWLTLYLRSAEVSLCVPTSASRDTPYAFLRYIRSFVKRSLFFVEMSMAASNRERKVQHHLTFLNFIWHSDGNAYLTEETLMSPWLKNLKIRFKKCQIRSINIRQHPIFCSVNLCWKS